MNKLIVIRGPLGVGKTTVSKILVQNLHADYLSLDQMIDDNNLNDTDGIPLENFLKANEIILKFANKNKNICIVDGCFYYQEQIEDLKKKFDDKIVIFTLVSNVEKCIERDSKRAKVYGEDSVKFIHIVVDKIKAGYEIDNSNLTVQKTVKKILEKI